MMTQRGIIFDRDGTLIVGRPYLHDPAQVELIPGAADALRTLAALGLPLAVATNQSGIGRGYFLAAQMHAVHRRMADLLEAEGVRLPPIYWCPHHPEEHCACRKPSPGLVHRAAAELGFDPSQSFVIGDDRCDIELGQRVGSTTILVRTGYGDQVLDCGHVAPDFVINSVGDLPRILEPLLFPSRGDHALKGPHFADPLHRRNSRNPKNAFIG